jgi:hypothetical protein
LTFGNKWGTFLLYDAPPKRMKPSVWVQIDPDDESLEGGSVSQRVGNYLPDSRWRKRYRPTDWPVLKLWRRSAVAARPWECQSKPVPSSGARSDRSHQSRRAANQPCCGTVVCARCGRTASTLRNRSFGRRASFSSRSNSSHLAALLILDHLRHWSVCDWS